MIKLPTAQPAPALQYKYGTYMGWGAAALLIAFALIHLFRIDTFIPELNGALPGGYDFALFVAVTITMMEVFAIPFVLRMRLSRLASFLSGIFGIGVPLFWVLVSIWNFNTGISSAQFGEFKESVVDGWLLTGNILWLAYAYVTVWALGFDKSFSPAFVRLFGPVKKISSIKRKSKK